MTATAVKTRDEQVAEPPPRRRHTGFWTALGVCATVAVLAQLPLVRNRVFYFWDDSAAQFLPMWHRIGTRLMEGDWPPLLDLDAWMGGNLAAETLFGIHNPVNLANYVAVAALPDLGVAAVLVKTEFLVLLALGLYLLCREYGAARPASAALAVALPFSGYLLYFDAASWASGLMAFAFVPHVWWTTRRAARGGLNPFWAFVIAALAVTAGNPYGLLGVAVVFLGLLVEFTVRRKRRAVTRVLGVGVCAGLVVPLVFLPLLGSASVTWRSDTSVVNDGFLVPGLTDLLAASTPTHLPHVPVFSGTGMTVPAAYFAWFVIPLLPWLDWRTVRQRRHLLVAPLVVAAVFAVAALGPSKLWLFRWPIRHLEYCFLACAVVLAVLLSAGPRTDRARVRATLSGVLVAVGTYLAWASVPDRWPWHLGGGVLVAVLTAAAVGVHRYGATRFAAFLGLGTATVLGYQLAAFPANTDVSELNYPHSVAALRDAFADRYPGEVMQIADLSTADDTLGLHPDGAWRYFLFGNVYAPAGVDSLVSYTGLGFHDFLDAFCLNNSGSTTCPEAWDALWRPTPYGGAPLADLLGVETVVVQNALVPNAAPPPGWRVRERDDVVTVLHRDDPLGWSDATVTWASPGVEVAPGESTAQRESLRFDVGDLSRPARLVFARLDWPGYRAEVNGDEVPVRRGPAGLVTVTLPEGTRAGHLELSWSPPGYSLGLASAALGVLGALGWGANAARGRPTGQTNRRSEAQRDSS